MKTNLYSHFYNFASRNKEFKMKNIFLLLIIILSVTSCNTPSSKYIYNEGFIYGTIYHITYESPEGRDLQDEITEQLNKYKMIFSTYEPESEISKVNNNEPVDLSPEFIICFNRAMEISRATNGAFDITAGPLVNAWGFGPDTRKTMNQQLVDSLLQLTGYQKVKLEDAKIIKELEGMKLDMSAISKGYTCDLIGNYLKENGCENYMVEIGGEVVAYGVNEKGNAWTIGISKPEESALFASGDIQAKVMLPNDALATSGNYRNYYVEDGKKYAHTIDPKSGYPVQHSLLSATVLAHDCMTADAYATGFMVLGVEKSITLAENNPLIEVYFIYALDDGQNAIYMSEGFKEHLKE